MIRNTIKIIKKILVVPRLAVATLLLSAVVVSCVKENMGYEDSSDADSLELGVVFANDKPQSASKGVTRSSEGESLDSGQTFWVTDAPDPNTRVGEVDQGTEAENRIDKLTVLVFNEAGTKLECQMIVDVTANNTTLDKDHPLWKDTKTLNVRPVKNKASKKQIYVIANWAKTDFDKRTYTLESLKNELIKAPSLAALNTPSIYPLLMSGNTSIILGQSNSKVTVQLSRQLSKINVEVKMSSATQRSHFNCEWLFNEARIVFGNVPSKSFVVDRRADGVTATDTLLSSSFLPLPAIEPTEPLPNYPIERVWRHGDYHIFESPTAGVMPSVDVIVQLPYKNILTGEVVYNNYYRVAINDLVSQAYKVYRNTIYKLNIRIKGLGEPLAGLITSANVDVQLEVNPWVEKSLDIGSAQRYFNVSTTRVEFQVTDTERKIVVKTDIPGWKFNAGGNSFSFIDGKTTGFKTDNMDLSISGTASLATITMKKALSSNVQKVTFYFIVNNLEVPLYVNGDNGIILNKDLEAAGWHATAAERPVGVQVAKKGNVLPSGDFFEYDLSRDRHVWSTETPARFTGVTLTGYGTGKSNTEALYNLSNVYYLPVNRCKALGEGWYLPSKDELAFIDSKKKSLGVSYIEPFIRHWTSSELSETQSYFLGVNSVYGAPKSDIWYTRCIRNI